MKAVQSKETGITADGQSCPCFFTVSANKREKLEKICQCPQIIAKPLNCYQCLRVAYKNVMSFC